MGSLAYCDLARYKTSNASIQVPINFTCEIFPKVSILLNYNEILYI